MTPVETPKVRRGCAAPQTGAGHLFERISVLPRRLPLRPMTPNPSVPGGDEVGSETCSVAEARRLAHVLPEAAVNCATVWQLTCADHRP